MALIEKVLDNAPLVTMSWGAGKTTAGVTVRGKTFVCFPVDALLFTGRIKIIRLNTLYIAALVNIDGDAVLISPKMPLYKVTSWIDRTIETGEKTSGYKEKVNALYL